MINIQLKFEAKNFDSSKVVIHKESHKILKFQGQFDLKGQGQGHHFSNTSETFRCPINSSSWKVKLEMVQFLTDKTKILEV